MMVGERENNLEEAMLLCRGFECGSVVFRVGCSGIISLTVYAGG